MLLKHAGIDAKVLSASLGLNYLHYMLKFGNESLMNSKTKYFSKNDAIILAHKGEKKLIKHIKEDKNILIFLDLPIHKKEVGVLTPFLGMTRNFSYFAFKLSINYNKPIFICYQEKSEEKDKYNIRFKELNNFSTQEEGLKQYLSFVEELIKKDPSMWFFAPLMKKWGKEALEMQREKQYDLPKKEVSVR